MKAPPPDQLEAAIRQLDAVRKELLLRPNVTAVDVGYKIKDKKLTDQLAIRVHVTRKLAPEALSAQELIPETIGDFPTDVIESTYGPQVDRRARINPLVGGVSIGNPRVTAGTLGAIVWDRRDCKPCILSNWHVLAASPIAVIGEPIYQPGVTDGGRSSDTVASLKRWRLNRDMDAGLAELNDLRQHTRDLLELSPIPGSVEATLGMEVVKSGRTTGLTQGVIDGVSVSLPIVYSRDVSQMFHDQIHIVPRPPWPEVDYEVTLGGDSGSVWVEEASGKAVGLHFAGENDQLNPSPLAENAVACKMTKIETQEGLNFSFTPLFCDPGDGGNGPGDGDGKVLTREDVVNILRRWFPDLGF